MPHISLRQPRPPSEGAIDSALLAFVSRSPRCSHFRALETARSAHGPLHTVLFDLEGPRHRKQPGDYHALDFARLRPSGWPQGPSSANVT